MNTKTFYHLTSIILFPAILSSLISCGDKKTAEEKEFEKTQKIYNKKGIEGFLKYVEEEKYFPVKDSEKDEATPLLLVVEDKNIENAKVFLEKGASIDEKDANGNDLIDYALKSADSETIDFAISAMPQDYWNQADADGKIPIFKIITNSNDFDLVRKAIDLTKNIDYSDENSKTLLMYAAQCNIDVRVVKYLLDNGAEINKKNYNEWTALMYSARYNPNPAVMEDLILRGANAEPNSVGLSITMLASCNPNPGVLMTLLKYKNEINKSTDKGKTALMYACENGQNFSVIKMLIDNGADLTAKDATGKNIRDYLSANPSLSTSDIALAWKSAEETINTETAETDSTTAEETVNTTEESETEKDTNKE